MDRKMLTIILGLALVGCFFLEYWAGMSGFDFVKGEGNDWQKYIWGLIPLAGLLLFIGALNNGNYILGRGFLSWLPLLALIYLLIISPMIHGMSTGNVFKALGKGYGIGLWITIGVSLVLVFYNPRPRA
jgi:hypothetical protein